MKMTNELKLQVVKLREGAILPTRANPTDAGLDLYAVEDVIIQPGETKVVKTGIAIKLPPNTVGDVRPRSGISAKTKLRVANAPGTIDEDYRGEIGIIFDNTRKKSKEKDYTVETVNPGIHVLTVEKENGGSYIIRKGDKIAQLVITPILKPVVEEVETLDETERGAGGFGSTGVR